MKYDLHIHSNVSDGKKSREEIIKKALEQNLEFVSFTEHNEFKPISEELKNKNLIFVNGIEFDTFFDKSFHMLCYFKREEKYICNLIEQYKQNTNDRSEELIKKISKLHNIDIEFESVMAFFNKKYITKRDIIDWIIFNNYAKTVDEAAYNFTSKNAISYVPKYSLNFVDVADAVKNMDGKLILAHPCSLNYNIDELENFIKKLVFLGLDGIEVINTSKINTMKTSEYKYLAEKYKLFMSAGSDFHDFERNKLGIEGEESKKLIKSLI